MGICALPITDKKLLANKVGQDLVRTHGKRKHYSVEQVKAACRRQNTPGDWDCWALTLYVQHNDFVDHHVSIGESCDYVSMNGKMVNALSTPDTESSTGHYAASAADSSVLSERLDWVSNSDLPDFDVSDIDL